MDSAKIARLAVLAAMCGGTGAILGAAFGIKRFDLLLACAAMGLGFCLLVACVGYVLGGRKG